MRNHEKFKNIASGIQSLVLAVAVAIGGYWTLFIFNKTLVSQTADAKLIQISQQIQVEKLNALNFKITARQQTNPENKNSLLFIQLEIQNNGSNSTRITWEKDAVSIAKVHSTNTNGEHFYSVLGKVGFHNIGGDGNINSVISAAIRPHQKHLFETVFPVSEAGVYLISFNAKPQENDILHAEQLSSYPAYMSPSTYVIVD